MNKEEKQSHKNRDQIDGCQKGGWGERMAEKEGKCSLKHCDNRMVTDGYQTVWMSTP